MSIILRGIGQIIPLPKVREHDASAGSITLTLTLGAFAFFGPGEFSTLYRELCGGAAHGYLHFAGEALSVRHAFVYSPKYLFKAYVLTILFDYPDGLLALWTAPGEPY